MDSLSWLMFVSVGENSLIMSGLKILLKKKKENNFPLELKQGLLVSTFIYRMFVFQFRQTYFTLTYDVGGLSHSQNKASHPNGIRSGFGIIDKNIF
jgi:hypothetical protein